VPSWPADSRFLGVLQALGAPLLVPEAAAITEGLPAEETALLEQSGVDLAVPIPIPGRKAVLLLGPKRSAEPWDREERQLLATIALALGKLALSGKARTGAPSAPLPSSALAGRYRLDRVLGTGGMGVVYEAMDSQLQRRVAVKLLREDRAQGHDAEKRFRREARALAAFSHPNVVTIHDFGLTAEGKAFLVMEFLSGPTLRQLMKAGPLVPARALEILGGVSDAVEAAHRRQLVHRDLKPENVILARGETEEVPKVLDFGLARLLPVDAISEVETATRGVVGTPRYMAPEQMRGGAVGRSWDFWAFSVMAYEMLTGRHPFDGDPAGWRAALLDGHLQLPTVPTGDAPRLDALFIRAFAPRQGDRHSSLRSFLADLGAALPPRAGPDGAASGPA
jgi:tRNA A-37 threonylcarbamoyl transferase component Bud32